MAYRPGEIMRLKDIGFTPKTILDIGAHTGQFYGWAKDAFPDSFIWMVEANDCHEDKLRNIVYGTGDRYTIATMGGEEKEVTFYTRKDKPHTEGASYYKEAAYWDIPQLVMEIPKTLQTLDELFDDESEFELIKLDTQGSELDILSGGVRLCKKAKYMVLEVSYVPLNEGAPEYDEVISYMKNYGFEVEMEIGEHYNGDELIQKDLLFKNVNI
jgi:FkbM family methyltransferase